MHGSSSFFYFFLPPFRQERRRGKRKGKKEKKLPEKFGGYAFKFLPLHPLSERNSIAVKTAIFEQIYINNTSSTRARPLPGNGGWSWVKQKNRQYLSMTGIDKLLNSSVLNRAKTYSCPGLLSYSLWGLVLVSASWISKILLQWRVWSWLRMNASYRLNTCKSRGSMNLAC